MMHVTRFIQNSVIQTSISNISTDDMGRSLRTALGLVLVALTPLLTGAFIAPCASPAFATLRAPPRSRHAQSPRRLAVAPAPTMSIAAATAAAAAAVAPCRVLPTVNRLLLPTGVSVSLPGIAAVDGTLLVPVFFAAPLVLLALTLATVVRAGGDKSAAAAVSPMRRVMSS